MREGLQLGLAAADPHEIRRGVQDLAVALEAEHRTMARRWMPRDVSRSAWRHRRKMTPNEIRCLDLDEVRRRYDGGTTEVRRRYDGGTTEVRRRYDGAASEPGPPFHPSGSVGVPISTR
jgi:hypothetical protein